MKKIFTFLILIYFNSYLYSLDIDKHTTNLNLLEFSQIYIDKQNSLKYIDIKDVKFQSYRRNDLNFGFLPNSSLWIKIKLRNNSSQKISKVLEFNSAVTENIFLFDNNIILVDGMWHINNYRKSINPNFSIYFESFEEKNIYIKINSTMSALNGELKLWNEKDFLINDYENKIVLSMFFSILIVLLIYNLSIFIFIKQKVIIYYCLYLFGLILFQGTYTGLFQLYIFTQEVSIIHSKAVVFFIGFLTIPIILFTREFLNLNNFTKIDFLFRIHLYIIPIIGILSFNNMLFDTKIVAFYFLLSSLIIFTSIYTFIKGLKEARFYILGWLVVVLSLILMSFKNFGWININEYLPYLNEFAFLFEAILFSLALAYRFKTISDEKEKINSDFILYQEKEKINLQKVIKDKTLELEENLKEKEILYKELNHRIKNNFQMILSIINIQMKNSSNEVKDDFLTISNRIKSFFQLYDLLNQQNDLLIVDTYKYFNSIIKNIKMNFTKNIEINLKIDNTINITSLLYLGLIINELVTNCFKYAFEDIGKIDIIIEKRADLLYLIVVDNGKGIDNKRGLGLEIVNILVKNQLNGEINIINDIGTKIEIKWMDY